MSSLKHNILASPNNVYIVNPLMQTALHYHKQYSEDRHFHAQQVDLISLNKCCIDRLINPQQNKIAKKGLNFEQTYILQEFKFPPRRKIIQEIQLHISFDVMSTSWSSYCCQIKWVKIWLFCEMFLHLLSITVTEAVQFV